MPPTRCLSFAYATVCSRGDVGGMLRQALASSSIRKRFFFAQRYA